MIECQSIRQSNPFSRLLAPLNDCQLNDFSFRALLLLKQARDHQASLLNAAGEGFQLLWPELEVVAIVAAAATIELDSSSSASLIYVTAGRVCLLQGDEHFCATAGSCLIVSGQPIRWISTAFSVVCLTISSERLGAIAASIQSDVLSASQATLLLGSPICCRPSGGQLESHLLSLLDCSLRAISQLQESNPMLVKHLGLVDQMSALMVALAFPSLRHEAKVETLQPVDGRPRDSFDQLIDYISANLDQPLSLATLAGRSNYSRRALQYVFRQRMGCTATQWIRARRLDLARQRLLMSSPGDNVTSIALACGYRSMGLFSIEFQQRFHIKPSQLLRSSRSTQGSPAQEP